MAARSARSARTFLSSLSSRRRVGMVALGILTVVGLGIPVQGAAIAAEQPAHHVSTPLERSLEAGTIGADIDSGRITDQQVKEAGENGLTLRGKHIDGWLKPTAAQQAEAAKLEEQLRADPSAMTMGGDAVDIESLMDGLADPAAPRPPARTAPAGGTGVDGATGLTDSKHWWNVGRNYLRKHVPHIYLNGPWFKALEAASFGAALGAICSYFKFMPVACGVVGFAVTVIIELAKNSKCGRVGIHVYYPVTFSWLDYC